MTRERRTIRGRWGAGLGLTCAIASAAVIWNCSGSSGDTDFPPDASTGGDGGGNGGGNGGGGGGGADGGGSSKPPSTPTDGATPIDSTTPVSDGSTTTDSGSTPTDSGSSTDAPPTPTSGCGKASGGSGNFTIDVSGTSRAYIVKIPGNYDMNKPYKLVFAWHGATGTAQQIAQSGYYGLETRAANSTIFVAGQGLDAGQGTGWPNTNGQDVAFVKAMVDWMRANYCVDNARIFSVGMSYGGIMSNTLGCSMGDVFRAIAPMSGMGPFVFGTTKCVGQTAAWLAHGNADTTVAFDSGIASRDYWRTANHCTANSSPSAPAPCVSYQGCDTGFPVNWCEFDGGHTVPTFAPEGIWNFFSQF